MKKLASTAVSSIPELLTILLTTSLAVIAVLSFSTTLMTASLIVIVLVISLLVYNKKESFGEASFPLVGGLLTILRVDWTMSLYWTFMITWVAFAIFAFTISAIKIHTKVDDLLTSATIAMGPKTAADEELRKMLNRLVSPSDSGQLKPTQRAEIIERLAYMKLSPSFFKSALDAVETLHVITKVDHEAISTFVMDFISFCSITSENQIPELLDRLYLAIHSVPTPPANFFKDFQSTRKLLITKEISPDEFLDNPTLFLESY